MINPIPVFTHSGALGDILYSLPFCQAFSQALGYEQFDFIITANLPFFHGHQHPAGSVMTSMALANFLLPLLQQQAIIRNADVVDLNHIDTSRLSHCQNLDQFRQLPINLAANHLANHYFYLTHALLKKDFYSATLKVEPDVRAAGKIIVFRSSRYRQPELSYQSLHAYKDHILYLGLPQEYEQFRQECFECEHMVVANALEAAQLMQGASLIVGNQTFLFAIAEQLKVPRLLEQAPNIPNVLTMGGWAHEIISQSHFDGLISRLVK